MHGVGSSTTPLPTFLHGSHWHSVGSWTTSAALRTARCISAQHLVLVLGNRLQSRENLGRVKDCYECVDRACQTPAAQIQEGSQVGKRQVHHARLAKRHCTNCTRKSAGCIEGKILAKRRGSLCTPHHADPEVRLGKLAGEANEAAVEGDMGRVFVIAKKLKSRHDRPHRVIRDEDGVLLVDEDHVTARWRRHWAKLLHRQETRSNTPNNTLGGNEWICNTQGGNEWICSRCTMSSLL